MYICTSFMLGTNLAFASRIFTTWIRSKDTSSKKSTLSGRQSLSVPGTNVRRQTSADGENNAVWRQLHADNKSQVLQGHLTSPRATGKGLVITDGEGGGATK